MRDQDRQQITVEYVLLTLGMACISLVLAWVAGLK